MSKTQPNISRFGEPDLTLLGESTAEFLGHLTGPSWFEIEGIDRSRRRVVVTLLHGNEPSGLKAMHALLSQGVKPATDLGILIAGVDAARHPPVFSHRFIPGERDLNRCFSPTIVDDQHTLCKNIVNLIEAYSPEAVVDTHNTSSHSEPFCVAVDNQPETKALAARFSRNLIVINQPLGTLLEHLDPKISIVTAEFGGFMDPRADDIAFATLREFITAEKLTPPETETLQVLEHSLRLETKRELTVVYGSTLNEDADLTIINTIDQLNFSLVDAGRTLGWFTESEHGHLHVMDENDSDVFDTYFLQKEGLLTTRQPMTFFMATTDPVVANTDCLLYFNPVRAIPQP